MADDTTALASEIKELREILDGIPTENAIERLVFEQRLDSVSKEYEGKQAKPQKLTTRLTFRGDPVHGSHGMAAKFGTKATGAFSEAFTAIMSGIQENLRYMGPIPDRDKHQLMITGTAIGSFGFEFELPFQHDDLFPDASQATNAIERLQDLLRISAEGTDDEVTEIVEEVHPRAVKKVADFLDILSRQEAWCGLEFEENYFRYDGVEQLRISAERLSDSNIKETTEIYMGEFQGVLPKSRTFEFKIVEEDSILRGKIDASIEDPDVLNREWLHIPVRIELNVIQVGHGRPRFSLSTIENVTRLTQE